MLPLGRFLANPSVPLAAMTGPLAAPLAQDDNPPAIRLE